MIRWAEGARLARSCSAPYVRASCSTSLMVTREGGAGISWRCFRFYGAIQRSWPSHGFGTIEVSRRVFAPAFGAYVCGIWSGLGIIKILQIVVAICVIIYDIGAQHFYVQGGLSMPENRSSFGKVARLCQMYLDQYHMYEAAQASPDMQRATAIAEESLAELLLSLEKMVSPVTFMQSLEAQAAKENEGV